MKFWKQLLASIAVLAIALLLWITFDPNAAGRLAGLGLPVPQSLIGAKEGETTPDSGGGFRGRGLAKVMVEEAETGIVNDRFSAIGTGAPVRTVSVQPQVSGQIDSIRVSSGAAVEAGDVLVELDASEETIALDLARLAVKTAEDKVTRTDNLLKQRTISSVEADQARTDLENSQLALRQAELNLRRRTITAPISGTIGILNVNQGDFVTNQTVVSTIDDREHILLEFYVPERLVGALSIGTPVEATSIARPGESFEGEVMALDNRLDQESRTLRVRADIPNVEDRLRAGMSFQLRMSFAGETYPSVDPLTIQWDSNGSYVWRVTDGKVERVEVTIIQRNAESVLVDAQITPGDLIVTEGVQNVRAGGAVEIVGSNAPDADADENGKTVENGRAPQSRQSNAAEAG
jgi:RND family efflux transporter MFP subunit